MIYQLFSKWLRLTCFQLKHPSSPLFCHLFNLSSLFSSLLLKSGMVPYFHFMAVRCPKNVSKLTLTQTSLMWTWLQHMAVMTVTLHWNIRYITQFQLLQCPVCESKSIKWHNPKVLLQNKLYTILWIDVWQFEDNRFR